MAQTSGLTVRQHEREGIEVPVEFEVCAAHASQAQFSPRSTAVSRQCVRGKAVDISSGGMGLELRLFVPRMCEGVVRVLLPDPTRLGSDGTPFLEPAFEHAVKVRRVYLIGREPSYALGVAFIDPDASIDRRITRLLERVREAHNRRPTTSARGGGHA